MLIPAACVLLALISLVVGVAVAVTEKKVPGEQLKFFAIFSAILAFWFIYV